MYFIYEGVSVYYTLKGCGKPLLLLHGWGADGRVMNNIAEHYRKHFTVITPDFPPFGMSSALNGDYTLEDYKNIITALLKELNIEKTAIICHSFGCRVALKIAQENPQTVNSLTICSGAGLPYKRTIKKSLNKIRFKVYKFLSKRGIIKESSLKKFYSSDYNSLPENMRKTFVNIINEDMTDTARKVKCPTLIIWGNRDRETPLYMGHDFNKLINGSRLCVIKGGHYGFLDNFEEFIQKTDEFLLNEQK
jgi:pimeloyl-ACP methyl ester carboxylesterase